MSKELTVLKDCMQAAAKVIHAKFGKVGFELKGRANLVTAADTGVQKAVLSVIKKNFPTHDFLAEENGLKNTQSDYLWVIDPIDGTTNFAHTFPHFSVSIALFYKNEPILGGVFDVMTNELFLAQKGKGATLNGKKIHVSNVKKLEDSLLVTGFPYDRAEHIDELLGTFKAFLLASHDVRRLGSAALDLCWTATGRIDGYWEENLNPWDVAAGALILAEAGGKVTAFDGRKWKNPTDYGHQVVAGNPAIHRQMLNLLKKLRPA